MGSYPWRIRAAGPGCMFKRDPNSQTISCSSGECRPFLQKLRVPEMTHVGPGPVTSAKFAGVLFYLILWLALGRQALLFIPILQMRKLRL